MGYFRPPPSFFLDYHTTIPLLCDVNIIPAYRMACCKRRLLWKLTLWNGVGRGPNLWAIVRLQRGEHEESLDDSGVAHNDTNHSKLLYRPSGRPSLSQRKTTNFTIRPIVSVFERAVSTDPDPRRSITSSRSSFRFSDLIENFWGDIFIHSTTRPNWERCWSNRG